MGVVLIAAHGMSLAHGIAAALACLAVFYALGLALVPRRWHASLGRGETPAVLGAALYVLACWFGIERGVSLTRSGIGCLAVVAVLTVARRRRLRDALGPSLASGAALRWALAFAGFYALAYLYTMPPATSEHLPVAWTGNIDLFTYVRYTKYLGRLGPSNVAGFSYMNFVYLQTPAVFYLLGFCSLFFGQEPLNAAMPVAFALTALMAMMVARISRSVFSVSGASALAIGAVAISAPFFRYVAGAYFLSTLMATPVFLYLVRTTVERRPAGRFDAPLAIRFAAAYILLLFMYPFLMFAGIAAQVASVGLRWVADMQAGGPAWRAAARSAVGTAGAMLAPLALLGAGLQERIRWSIDMVWSLSEKGVAGWPLEFISPLAVLGVPGAMTDHNRCAACFGIEVLDPTRRAWALGGYGAIALALLVLYFVRFRRRTTPAARTLAGLAAGAFLAYCAYFLMLGPSYQQWKFASYTALPLSFVALAGGWQLWHESDTFARLSRAPAGRLLMGAVLFAAPASLVAGNLTVHAVSDPDLLRLPGALRNIASLDRLPFRELSIRMVEDSGELPTWVALYYLPSKRVHVTESTFSPSEPLSFEQISRQWPLFVHNYGCEGIGHGDTVTVQDAGCLMTAPPSLAEDVPYPFNRSFLFVGLSGFGPREPGGRWNWRSSVLLTLHADPRRIRVGQDLYVNLHLSPVVPQGDTGRRMAISWGDGRRAETALTGQDQISLRVTPRDWNGRRLRTLQVGVEFPDTVSGTDRSTTDARDEAPPPPVMLFQELSISSRPRGTLVPETLAAP